MPKMKLTRAERKAGMDLRDVIGSKQKSPEGFSTYFGDVTITRDNEHGTVTATFKMVSDVDLDETEDTAQEALDTLCDTLDSIAAQTRENAREWLGKENAKEIARMIKEKK